MTVNASTCMLCALLALPLASNAAIIENGSFENPMGTWVNSGFNYMAVASGSPAITGWAVANALGRGVAWAQNPTNDGYFASAGSYFVDLSGFGVEAGPNAALTQELRELIVGETYTVGIDYWGDRVTMAIAGTPIAMAASASGAWTRVTATFQATSAQMALSIGYIGASGVAFVDNLTVTGPSAAVPEPGTFVLACAALAALGGRRRRG
jgi:hypothetical protein